MTKKLKFTVDLLIGVVVAIILSLIFPSELHIPVVHLSIFLVCIYWGRFYSGNHMSISLTFAALMIIISHLSFLYVGFSMGATFVDSMRHLITMPIILGYAFFIFVAYLGSFVGYSIRRKSVKVQQH